METQMTPYRLPRHGATPLEFHGQQAHEFTTHEPGGPLSRSWHEVRIYRAQDWPGTDAADWPGDWVVEIVYRTTVAKEVEHRSAVALAYAEDIPFYLKNYDPTAHLKFPSGNQFLRKQIAVRRLLREAFEHQVGLFLAQERLEE